MSCGIGDICTICQWAAGIFFANGVIKNPLHCYMPCLIMNLIVLVELPENHGHEFVQSLISVIYVLTRS